MKILKNIFMAIAVLGFIIALGTAGISDREYKTGLILMTESQFILRILTATGMLAIGSLGARVCNLITPRKRHYRAIKRTYRATHNQQKTVA